MVGHREVVKSHHKFSGVSWKGFPWDLSHLGAFAMRVDPGLGYDIDVVVLFSSHCFSQSFKRDGRNPAQVPADEIFDDGRERRVLHPPRYEMSRRYLPAMVKELHKRTIQIAASDRQNFVTFEEFDGDGKFVCRYGVFFEPTRDSHRKKRIVLRVQSAYAMEDGLTKRLSKPKKVNFLTLLRKVYLGEKIRG